MHNSLRLDILNKIVATFAAIKPDELLAGTPADWPIQFSAVELGPLGDADHKKRFTAGVVPLRERYSHVFPFIERHLSVGIEYRVTVNRGDDKSGVMAENLLTVLERVVLNNTTWDGLALDTELDNNEVDMSDYNDKSVQGVLFITVKYRHQHLDPRDDRPD